MICSKCEETIEVPAYKSDEQIICESCFNELIESDHLGGARDRAKAARAMTGSPNILQGTRARQGRSGRPSKGETKKVSLSMSSEMWDYLDDSADGNRSAYFHSLLLRDMEGSSTEVVDRDKVLKTVANQVRTLDALLKVGKNDYVEGFISSVRMMIEDLDISYEEIKDSPAKDELSNRNF